MDTIFMKSENSKSSDPHRLLLSLTDEIKLKRSDKYVAYQSIYYTWKNIKSHTKIIILKCQLQHEAKNLNYLMDHILYQIFKIILSISSKSLRQLRIIL